MYFLSCVEIKTIIIIIIIIIIINSMLFASVPCNASINKSSASHFCPVRVRILWLLAAVNCLSLPFTYRTLRGHASLFPPSLPCPFYFQLTQAQFHFSVSYSASVIGTVANSIRFEICEVPICTQVVLRKIWWSLKRT